MGLSRTVFEIKGNICKIFNPIHLGNASGEGIPLGLFNGSRAQKNSNDALIRPSKKYNDTSVHLDTVAALDRQTDGQNC